MKLCDTVTKTRIATIIRHEKQAHMQINQHLQVFSIHCILLAIKILDLNWDFVFKASNQNSDENLE